MSLIKVLTIVIYDVATELDLSSIDIREFKRDKYSNPSVW